MKRILILLLLFPAFVFAQNAPDTIRDERFSFHFQQTVISQYHPNFHAPYEGMRSLRNNDGWHTSLTSTLFMGARLWKGGELYFNPELAGGSGVSGATGIAGFANGETFRVGDPTPALYVARIFLRQHFALGPDKGDYDAGGNLLGGRLPSNRLTFTLGKFCMADIFDANSYSHDPRTQFFNWALMDAGGWDYPANTRGYTYSFVAEYYNPGYVIRAAASMVPDVANGPYLDMNFGKAHSGTIEFEKPYKIAKRDGTLRLLVFHTTAHMGSYKQVLESPAYYDTAIENTRKYGRVKMGIVLNMEQSLSKNTGVFLRASYNDGKNETWAFTEIDQSVSGGIVFQGEKWKRPNDKLGLAFIVNGISKDHRDYLAAGGYGFIIGDGKLPNYGNEIIGEVQYNFALNDKFSFTPDYQFVLNPAYNKDRGPVQVIGFRGHIEF